MPLIITGLLCVQILSAAREPVVLEIPMPVWLIALDAAFILINAALAWWVAYGSMPASLNYPVVTLAFLLTGLKPVAFMIAAQDPGPFYMAVVMLAGALCFLSMRYLIISMTLITAAWLAAALQVLPTATTISGLLITLLGSGLSVLVLRRRRAVAIGIYELRQRVETLESILPMCASCKKTRDHAGNWKSVEEYIEDQQAGTQISHGSCPSCTEELYGDLLNKNKDKSSAA